MRRVLPIVLPGLMLLTACSDSPPPAHRPLTLVIQPDDGRRPILDAIAEATQSVRLTIYAITDLQSVAQTPAAPAASVVQALIDKARSGVSVRVIVDQDQATAGASAAEVQATITQLQDAGAVVRTSSTTFCFTHQKT